MYYEAIPMYSELRRVPLMIRLPGQRSRQDISALVQTPDLMPTLLEMAGLVVTQSIGGQSQTQALQCGVFYSEDWQFRLENTHGKSLMPLMRGETNTLRDFVVCSHTLVHNTPILAKSAIVTKDGWCLHYAGNYEEPVKGGATYITKLIDPTLTRMPTDPALYYLPDDPGESTNLLETHEGLAKELHQRYVTWLEEVGTPAGYLAGRRSLR
jgi:hypothetical protein